MSREQQPPKLLPMSGVCEMNIVVFGGSGGIGSAIVKQVTRVFPDATVFATWNRTRPTAESRVRWFQVDLCSEISIQEFSSQFDQVHWVINAAGMLHDDTQMPEKSLQQIEPEFFMHNVQLNALSTLLIAKHFRGALKDANGSEVTKQFATISAKVGSIEDNRLGGWYSYRCSKAALNMAIKNLSIEWSRTVPDICVTALHPGTTDTGLSAPFQRNVPEGKLFSADKVADCFVKLMVKLTTSDTGKFFSYDGEELPW